MPWCVITGCNNNLKATKKHEKDVSYHIFPKNLHRREDWINSINQPFKFNADTSYICSKHFHPDDFECNSLKEQLLNIKVKRQLKRTAIPSINMPTQEELSRIKTNSIKYVGKHQYCAVPGCNNIVNCGPDEPRSLSHKFPSDTVLLKKWLEFCNIYKTTPQEYQDAQICSEHFNKDNYEFKYVTESLPPIKVLKNDAVPTLNGGIEISNIISISDELSRNKRKELVDKLLADYEEQQKNENGHLNGMITKYPNFFSPKINPNAKLGDKLKLLKSIDDPKAYSPKKKIKTSANSNTEHLSSSFIDNLTEKVNQTVQVTVVEGGLMLHALPQTANCVLSPHLEKNIIDEEEEIIIVTEDEASNIDLSSYEEKYKVNNTEVIIVTDSKETEDTFRHVENVPKKTSTNKTNSSSNKCHIQKLTKNNKSLFSPLYAAGVSSGIDKGCQVTIPCNGCENRSLKINKLLREKSRLMQDENRTNARKVPNEISTLKRMNGVLSLLLLQSIGEKNGKKCPSIRVDLVQDSIDRVERGWSMEDTSETLCQAMSINAYDKFARTFEVINEI